LLRGERGEIYIDAGNRRMVCELCKPRAIHEGWLREGAVPAYDQSATPSDRKSSLLNRFRGRREWARAGSRPTLADELDRQSWSETGEGASRLTDRGRERVREPRHVRAVPTSVEHKIASAIKLFNGSEHPRTVAGVARSLGPPEIAVLPSDQGPSLVNVVASWELCWYRYEIDLGDDQPSVRVAAQGYELDELAPEERQPNATSDEHGSLSLAG
jgi:hypothetical protein